MRSLLRRGGSGDNIGDGGNGFLGGNTAMDVGSIQDLATRFFDAIEAGDVATVKACYAPDARIWHNTDGLEQNRDDNAAVLAAMVKHFNRRKYDERRLSVFDGGFVQQHVLRAIRKRDGETVSLAACVVCEVADGRITRLNEYFDSAAVAAFVGRPAG